VLLDNNMPGLSGREAARLMLEEAPETRVLMLTVSEDADDLIETLRAGACGYLLKNIQAETLVSAIKTAAQGESVVSPQMMGKLLSGVRSAASRATTGGALAPSPVPLARSVPAVGGEAAELEKLSPREREILKFIARGQSNKEIARARRSRREHGEDPRAEHAAQAQSQQPGGRPRSFAVENGLGQSPEA